MGCLFSKPVTETETETETPGVTLVQLQEPLVTETVTPLTLADLEKALDPITAAIDRITAAIDRIAAQIGSFLVPDGDSEAKQSTVIITLHAGDNSAYQSIGHGIVVNAPNHTNANDESASKYYLLSAAHVLIGIAMEMKTTKGSYLKLSWLQNGSIAFEEKKKGALILHEDYISMGSHDYGFMELKSMTDELLPSHASMRPLGLHSPTVGHSVVAHGRVFLRGTVTGLIGTTPRFSVMAHSIPGSSGAPIFNNARQLVGVVHGSSKHRGHANVSMHDDNAAVAYADTIQVTKGLYIISENHWEWLSLAEAVPLEVASGRENPNMESITDISLLWTKLQRLGYQAMSEVTLKDIMDALKMEVVQGGIPTIWQGKTKFRFVFVSNSTSPE